MQVYRGLDIGTAKPTVLERRGVPHHMIDVAEPEEEFSVAEFRRMARELMVQTGGPLVISGGSGLHFRALVDHMSFAPTDPQVRASLEGLDTEVLREELVNADPEAGAVVDLENRRRLVRAVEILRLTGESPTARARTAEADQLRRYEPELEFMAVGLDPGSELDSRIEARLSDMRGGGLVEEVRALRSRLGRTASSAVGYREILEYLGGGISEAEAFAEVGRNTRKLARRQRTWFQRDPRIRWLPWAERSEDRIARVLEAFD